MGVYDLRTDPPNKKYHLYFDSPGFVCSGLLLVSVSLEEYSSCSFYHMIDISSLEEAQTQDKI